VSPADKPLKTPAREPRNERKGAIGLSEGGWYRIEVLTGCYGNGRGSGSSKARRFSKVSFQGSFSTCRPDSTQRPPYEPNVIYVKGFRTVKCLCEQIESPNMPQIHFAASGGLSYGNEEKNRPQGTFMA